MMYLIRFLLFITILILYSERIKSIKVKKIMVTSLLTSTFFQNPIISYGSTLDDYLVREIDFNANNHNNNLFKKPVKLQLIQGFASLKGKQPAKGGGDRTGTYTW